MNDFVIYGIQVFVGFIIGSFVRIYEKKLLYNLKEDKKFLTEQLIKKNCMIDALEKDIVNLKNICESKHFEKHIKKIKSNTEK